VTAGTIRHAKLQSNRHHQQTNIQFLTGQMYFLSPNRQRQNIKGRNENFPPKQKSFAYIFTEL